MERVGGVCDDVVVRVGGVCDDVVVRVGGVCVDVVVRVGGVCVDVVVRVGGVCDDVVVCVSLPPIRGNSLESTASSNFGGRAGGTTLQCVVFIFCTECIFTAVGAAFVVVLVAAAEAAVVAVDVFVATALEGTTPPIVSF